MYNLKCFAATFRVMPMTPSHETVLPPLIGDGHGRYKVKIMGNSGISSYNFLREATF
jgi:hypothetical protein